MKTSLFAAASAITLLVQPAFAADLPVKAPIRAAAIAPAYNWSGCYLGGFVGGASQSRSWSSTDIGSIGQGGTFPVYNGVGTNPWDLGRASSFIGGGTAGCNWQAPGSAFVLGIEGEIGSMRISSSALQPNSIDVNGSSRIGDWYGIIAGRGGFAVDRALFYVKGGVAFYETAATVIDLGNTVPGFTDTVTAAGKRSQTTWVLGGGIEYALTNNWSIKGEYLYLARGNSFNACGIDANVGQNFCWRQDPPGIHTAKFGLNYKFDWGGPVVARY
jgi:outer membrane immunogenic protein